MPASGIRTFPAAPDWTFRLPKERRVNARRPVIANGVAYVAFMYDRGEFSRSTLFALDLGTGSERWSYTIDHVGNEPVVADGVVYWSSFEGAVHALDREARLLWKAPGTTSNIGVPAVGPGNRLFVSEIAGGARHTWCLDRVTGATHWRFTHGGHSFRVFSSGERVYQTSVAPTAVGAPPQSSLHCLSAGEGRVHWSASSREYLFDPTVIEDRVHVCSYGKLFIHAAVDGRRIGEAPLPSESTTAIIAPCSTRDRLVVWGSNGGRGADAITAYGVRPVKRIFGGERLQATRSWTLDEPGGLCDAPLALSAEHLIYLTNDGVVRMISSATGEGLRALKLKTSANTFGGIALTDDRLLAAHGREAFLFSLGA